MFLKNPQIPIVYRNQHLFHSQECQTSHSTFRGLPHISLYGETRMLDAVLSSQEADAWLQECIFILDRDLLTVFSLLSFHGLTEPQASLFEVPLSIVSQETVVRKRRLLIFPRAFDCGILQLANVYLSEPELMVQRTKRQMSLLTNAFPFLFKILASHGCSFDFTYSHLISKELKGMYQLRSTFFNQKSKCLIFDHYL